MEQVRSFIAIELPESVKTALKQVQNILKSNDPSCAKWVDPESIHLTLKFLGNVTADQIDPIIHSMQESVRNISPFHLVIKGLGAFPNLRRVQIVWVGINGDLDKLQKLQNNLETNLSKLGFQPENRRFTPHLTLARVREFISPAMRQALGELISQTQFESNGAIEISSISLMRSQLMRSGAIYTGLGLVELIPSCQ